MSSGLINSAGSAVRSIPIIGPMIPRPLRLPLAVALLAAATYYAIVMTTGTDVFASFTSFGSSGVEVLKTGGGAGEGDGMATSSTGDAKDETYQPAMITNKAALSHSGPELTFDPDMDAIPYTQDTTRMNETVRTFPYNM